MSEIRSQIGNLAQTNYYFVVLMLSPQLKDHFSKNYPLDPELANINKFVERLGYLCSEASLPTTSYATAEVKDNFIGVTQEFAHTRLYTDLDMTFYVDADYQVLRFFEGWMDYISGGNSQDLGEPAAASNKNTNIYRRFNYPNFYKMQTMQIQKFERDYQRILEYQFINAFPKSIATVPVSYGAADILKVTVTFNFDRYIVTRSQFIQQEPEEGSADSKPGQPASISEPRLLLNKKQTVSEMVAELKSMQEASRLRQAGFGVGLGQNRDGSNRSVYGPAF
ncbi:MAG: hypothetical protein ACO3CE_04740 [Pelagibacteraceae bacterium]